MGIWEKYGTSVGLGMLACKGLPLDVLGVGVDGECIGLGVLACKGVTGMGAPTRERRLKLQLSRDKSWGKEMASPPLGAFRREITYV